MRIERKPVHCLESGKTWGLLLSLWTVHPLGSTEAFEDWEQAMLFLCLIYSANRGGAEMVLEGWVGKRVMLHPVFM